MIEEGPGPEKMSSPGEDRASQLLARYGALWVWTVLVGVGGGLSYNQLSSFSELIQLEMMGFRGGRMGLGGPPGVNDWAPMVMMASSAIGMLASIASWVCLYLFFTVYVLPVAIHGSSPVADDRRRKGGSMYLRRAYQLLILVAVSKVAPGLALIFANVLPK